MRPRSRSVQGRAAGSPRRSYAAARDDVGHQRRPGVWNLRRLVWVADRGFASAADRACLARSGGRYIHAEKLREHQRRSAAALARPGRYRAVAGNLRVTGIWPPQAGVRAGRFVVCHNPERALRD
jgi:hypothetical protein